VRPANPLQSAAAASMAAMPTSARGRRVEPRCPALGLVLGALLGALAACEREPSAEELTERRSVTAAPILVIGIDGAEWDLILPLITAHELPRFEALMRRGTFGLLETMEPTLSPVIWTSMATSKLRDEHGIRHFVHAGDDGKPVLYTSADRRTKAVWNILTEHDKRVCTVGWWMTFPAEEVSGVQVAQTNTTPGEGAQEDARMKKGGLLPGVEGQVHPPQRQAEMLAVLAEIEGSLPEATRGIFGPFERPLSELGQRFWEDSLWAFRADLTYARIGEKLLKEPFDLMLIYFGGVDVVSHRFWRAMRPELYANPPSEADVANFGRVIESYYRSMDSVLGRLLDAAPPQTTVFVVSDHGFSSSHLANRFDPTDDPLELMSGQHRDARAGVFIAAGPWIVRTPRELPAERGELEVRGSVLDLTPTWLALLRVPLGRDMRGKVLGGIVDPRFHVSNQPPPVPTHDTREFLERRATPARREADEEERLRELRNLGYFGDEKQ
jgi:type I phosphodiesterase/nucleotide pyrophosphatase